MNDYSFQGDLFNEKVLEKKRNRSRIFEKYSQQRVLSFIRLPIEYIVIFSIAVLILAIVAYAIGVERGKSLERDSEIFSESLKIEEMRPLLTEAENTIDVKVEVETTEIEIDPEKIQVEKVLREEKSVIDSKEEEKEIPGASNVSESNASGIYIVQLASYKALDPAKHEMRKLEAEGIKAGWKKNGDWYQLFARGFENASEAKKARNKLIRTYKDCYIKKIR